MILSDGTVVACCQDVNGKLALGNIKNSPINELWNKDHICELREKHSNNKRESIDICSKCNMYQPKWPLLVGATILSVTQTNYMLPVIESGILYPSDSDN